MKHFYSNVRGFTLIELVTVMVLLGVLSVGLSSFMGLATQAYVTVSERDELISTARFAIERLNREVRNALPNSLRVNATGSCLEFIPVLSSTIYKNIPLAPIASSIISVVPFEDSNGNPYQCGANCEQGVIVYPTDTNDIYMPIVNVNPTTGNTFRLNNVVHTANADSVINLANTVTFTHPSTTERLYVVEHAVSYCLLDNNGSSELYRKGGYDINQNLQEATADDQLMANHIDLINSSFIVTAPTLQRNGLLQLNLAFRLNDEDIVFNHDIHVKNTP